MARLFSDHYLNTLEPHEQALIGRVRTLCKEQIGPNAAAVGKEDVFSWDTFRALADSGIIATAFPAEFGGSDARQSVRIRITEELGRVCSAAASIATGTDLSSRAIVAGASHLVQHALLPGLARGEIQAAFGLTEPGAGSDVRGLATTMERTGDTYIVNGKKKFIFRAGVADWLVVVGRSTHDRTQFIATLIHKDSPGVSIGPSDGKLGWFGVPTASIKLENVSVPTDYRLGEEGDGFNLAQDALIRARIGHASLSLGRAMGAVEIAATYAIDRHVFGKPLGGHQGIQWKFAAMVTEIEAARALVALAAEKYDHQDSNSTMYASMAKLHATDLGMRIVSDALQLTGGRGYLQDFPLERFFRDAKLNQIGEGSSEVHRTVIGREVLHRAASAERHPCLRDGPLTDY